MAMTIDGKMISQQIKEELKEQVKALKKQGREITLAVIQVGNDPASSVYVRNKKKGCEYIGIGSLSYELPKETTQEELLTLIGELNQKKEVNGILVQLPLPGHIDEEKVIRAIDPKKDVDGFHPQSVGALCIGQPGFVSCTPAGMRGAGAEQYCGKTYGYFDAQGKCHSDCRSFQDKKFKGNHKAGGHFDRRGGET